MFGLTIINILLYLIIKQPSFYQMKLITIIVAFFYFSISAQVPQRIDQKIIRDVATLNQGTMFHNQINKTVKDNFGNIIVIGKTFNYGGLFNFNLKNGLDYDCVKGSYIAKYDSLNNLIWNKNIYTNAVNDIENLEIDNSNNIIVSFRQIFTGIESNTLTIDFNPDHNNYFVKTHTITSAYPNYVAKYDSNGNFVFGGNFNNPNSFKISIDKFNNIYLYGIQTTTLDCNITATLPSVLPNIFGSKCFVAKYDSIGNLLFNGQLSGGNSILKLRPTQTGITMINHGFSDFDFSTSVVPPALYGSIYFVQYDFNFNYLGQKNIGSGGAVARYYLESDKNNFYLFGSCSGSGTVDFDPGPSVSTLSLSTDTTFFTRYDNNINLKSLRSFGRVTNGVKQFNEDKIMKEFYISHEILSGSIIDYDPSPSNYTITNIKYNDVSVGKYDSTGNFLMAKTILSENNQCTSNLTFSKNKLFCFVENPDSIWVDFTGLNTTLVNKNGCGLASAIYNRSLTPIQSDINTIAYGVGSNGAPNNNDALSIVKSGPDFFVIGRYYDLVNYNPNIGSLFTFTSGINSHGIFIAKYDNNFNPIFVKQLTCSGITIPKITKVLIDKSGDLIITGNIVNDAITFNSTNTFITGVSGAFIAKYNTSSGNLIWYKGYQYATIADFDIDSNNDIFIIGTFQGPTVFNTSAIYSGPNNDSFLLKLNSNSSFVWLETASCSGSEKFNKIKIDKSDNIIIIAQYIGSGIGFLTSYFPNSLSEDAIIYKISPSKTLIFAHVTTGSLHDYYVDLDIDQENNIYLLGSTKSNNFDFDYSSGTTLLTLPLGCVESYFYSKYDSSFNFKFFNPFPIYGSQFVNRLKVDKSSKNTYLFGPYSGTFDINPSSSTKFVTGYSSLVAKFDSSGNYLFAEQFNKKAYNKVTLNLNDILFDNNQMFLVGNMVSGYVFPLNNFELDSTKLYNLPVAGGKDIFFAKYCNTPNAPIINSGNINICTSSNTTLTASSATTKWYTTAIGGSPFNIGNIYVTPSLTTNVTYYLQDSNNCGLSNRTPITINVFTTPTPTLTGNSSICIGQNDTLKVVGATSYTWSTGSISNSIIVTPTTTANFSVTTINPCGTSNANITVSVNLLPIVTIASISNTICNTSSLTLNGTGASTYSWSTGQSSLSILVTPTATSTFSIIGTDVNGCKNTAIKTISVVTIPNVLIGASVTSTCPNTSFILTGYNATTYTWNTGSNSNPLVTQSLISGIINYSVTGTDLGTGCSKTSSINITILASPSISLTASSSTICSSTQSTLYVNSSSFNTYTWSTGSSSNSITVSPFSSTTYSVKAKSVFGNNCISKDSIFITVNPSPTVSASSGTICFGDSFTITPNGASTYSYSGGSNIVSPISTTTYSVIGTNTLGCLSASPGISSVYVNPSPSITANSGTICSGDSFTITPSGASTYSYSGGVNIVSPIISTNYLITGSNAFGCSNLIPVVSTVIVNPNPSLVAITSNSILCLGQTVTVSVSGAMTYSWDNGASSNSIVDSPTITTTYSVTGTDLNGCSNSTSLTQSVSTCTGLKSLTNNEISINIYPNPSNGFFSVQLSSVSENTIIEVYTTLGQLILSQKITSENTVIDLKNCTSGLYYIKVTEATISSTFKLIKE